MTVTTAGGVILVPLGGWTPPSTRALGLLALAAVLLLIGYQCIIMALRSGDISAVAPFRYSALLWAMLLGYLVFGDVPDAMMVLGASIIVLSGLYAFYRERIRHRALAAESSGLPPDGLVIKLRPYPGYGEARSGATCLSEEVPAARQRNAGKRVTENRFRSEG